MNIAPTPWTTEHDGHGGICLNDAEGRQIGFVSLRPDQDAHAALLKAAPEMLKCLRAVEVLFAPQCRDSTQADWLDKTQELLRRLGAA